MASRTTKIDPVAEMERVKIGDRRLDQRARSLVRALEKSPSRSLPAATGSTAELEGAYRFLRNARVTLAKLLAPHVEATVERVRRATSTVVVAHDTTEFRFEGDAERPGLGEVGQRGQGFFAHVALAVTEERHTLGALGVQVVVRDWDRAKHRKGTDYAKRPVNHEGTRWRALIEDVQARVGDAVPVHVMDREGDEFEMISDMVEMGCRFVVRMSSARKRRVGRVDGHDANRALVTDAVSSLHGVTVREVVLSARSATYAQGVHPPRDRREAQLRFAAGVIELMPPRHKPGKPAPIVVNAVHVIETDPPAGEAPVEWVLYSNEPIASASDVLAIVDAYRARWVIEEYFKALKTGCAIERRQLESLAALVNCLGLFVPIAAKMLALRSAARLHPDVPASTVLSAVELQSLRIIARSPLPRTPTASQALFAIAAVGGHLRNNGAPGWLTLARGFETLSIAVQVATKSRRK